jgi:DNA-binding response OmpR family regulator
VDEVAASYSWMWESTRVVDLCGDGREAFDLAQRGGYDVLVLDRMVPGMDGLATVKSLPAAGVRTPVLFLTAVGGVGDRVEGLEAGGDEIGAPTDSREYDSETAEVRTLGADFAGCRG